MDGERERNIEATTALLLSNEDGSDLASQVTKLKLKPE